MPKENDRPDFNKQRLQQPPNRQAQEKLDDSRGRPQRGGEQSTSPRDIAERAHEKAPESAGDGDPGPKQSAK